ncbi:MAG: hypothetical protein MR473_03255 [Clostridiales bacterium]|nr:hypothetical protein [Clostridiales bacterium]
MRRGAIWMVGLALLLTGCAASQEPVWETVSDNLELPVSAQTPEYDISVAVPMDAPAVEALSGDLCQVYDQEDGQYELTVQTLTADSLRTLLRELTGFPQEKLAILRTEAFGMPRYDLTWISAGETGLESCRAAILDDGMHYYVLTAAVPVEQVTQCRKQIDQFFSSFGLYGNEGI